MGKLYSELEDDLKAFIGRQQMFFVATSPLSAGAHVNISPKGLDTFRILSPHRVAYLDLTGSGIETLAHLRENGRLTLMFCAFSGAPRILRLYGHGYSVLPHQDEWPRLRPLFPDLPGERAIIVMDVQRIADSCGYGVPLYDYAGPRTQLTDYAVRMGAEGLQHYRADKNRTSIDGLPGMI